MSLRARILLLVLFAMLGARGQVLPFACIA